MIRLLMPRDHLNALTPQFHKVFEQTAQLGQGHFVFERMCNNRDASCCANPTDHGFQRWPIGLDVAGFSCAQRPLESRPN